MAVHENEGSPVVVDGVRTDSNIEMMEKGKTNDGAVGKSEDGKITIESKSENNQPLEVTLRVRLKGPQLAAVFVGLALAIFLAALDQSIVATALPRITSDLGGFNQLSWVATAYLLTVTAFQPYYGRFSDIFGRKPVLLFAIAMFEVFSLLCGFAQNMIWLIICRALQGVGGAGLQTMAFIIISDIVSLKDRGKYQGIVGAMFALASVIGPLLGGAFTDRVTWRWCFFINLPFGVITVLAVVMFLNLPKPSGSIREKFLRIDFYGTVTLLPGVITLLLATSWGGNDYPWKSAAVISCYLISAVFITIFIYIEIYIAKEPILPMNLFKIRNISLTYATSFLVGFCMMGTVIYLPIFFQVVKGDSATTSGLRMLPIMLSVVICSMASGITIAKTGRYRPIIITGCALLSLGGLMSLLNENSSFGAMVGLLIPAGMAVGLTLQTSLLLVQAAAPKKEIASATAGLNFFRSIGFVIGIAVFGAIVNNKVASDLGISGDALNNFSISTLQSAPLPFQQLVKHAYTKAIDLAFLVTIAFGGASFILTLFLKHIPFSRDSLAGLAPME